MIFTPQQPKNSELTQENDEDDPINNSLKERAQLSMKELSLDQKDCPKQVMRLQG